MNREWIVLRGLARETAHAQPFIDLLQKKDPNAKVRGVDLPGAGEYHRLASPMSIDAIAEFIYSQVNESRPQERYIVAVSLGGMVATALARLYPQFCDGMVICNASFSNLSPVYHRLQLSALKQIYLAATAKNEAEKERAVLDMVSNRSDRQDHIEEWADIARQRPVSAANFLKQLFAAATYTLPANKPNIPILVLSSTCDHMVNPECSQKFAEYWTLPIESHPAAGHEIWMDAGEWVIEKTLQFFSIKT